MSVVIIRAIKFIFSKDFELINMTVETFKFKFYGKSLYCNYDHRIQDR